jgi:hypothetical protein
MLFPFTLDHFIISSHLAPHNWYSGTAAVGLRPEETMEKASWPLPEEARSKNQIPGTEGTRTKIQTGGMMRCGRRVEY